MRRLLEILSFVGIALGAHLWAFSLRSPDMGGSEGAGEAGDQLLTLSAASASLEQLVQEWDTPPETADSLDMTPPALPVAQPPDMPVPEIPDLASPALSRVPTGPGLALPSAAAAPVTLDTTPAIPQPPAPPTRVTPSEPPPRPQPDPVRPDPVRPVARDPAPDPTPDPTPTPKPKPEPAPVAKPVTKPVAKPAPEPARASAARAAQQAKGQGQSGTAGTARKPARDAATDKARSARLIASWGAQIRNRIERRKHVPNAARHVRATVKLRVVVGRDGSLRGVSVTKSSGVRALDQAALRSVQRAGRFPPAPKGLNSPSYTFSLPMQFAG